MTLQLEPTSDEKEAMAILAKSDVINTIKFGLMVVFVGFATFAVGYVVFSVPEYVLTIMGQ